MFIDNSQQKPVLINQSIKRQLPPKRNQLINIITNLIVPRPKPIVTRLIGNYMRDLALLAGIEL